MRNPIVAFCLLIGLFALCSTAYVAHAQPPDSSGIQGQAVVSANVTIYGVISGGSPVQTHARVLTSKGKFVTSFVTGIDGTFKLTLKPGDYVIVPDSPPNPYLQPVQTPVHVQKKTFTTVTIGYYDRPL